MRFCLLLILLVVWVEGIAQPPICPPTNAEMTATCIEACIICDIDGYSGRNDSPVQGAAPAGFCTITQHNVQWIGFIATSVNLTLEIAASNCINGSGLEVAIYESTDCNNFTQVSNCLGGANRLVIRNGTSSTISNTVPLVIGQYYYFVMDGAPGAICDYDISVVAGSTAVPPLAPITAINGNTETCPGGSLDFSINSITGAPDIVWFLNQNQVGTGENVMINFPDAGSYQLCVEASNICSDPVTKCEFITVTPIAPTDISESICAGTCFTAGDGSMLCNTGSYPINFLTTKGCDSLVNYNIIVENIPPTQLNESICDGEYFAIQTDTFRISGTQTVNLQNINGCDSMVVLDLEVFQLQTTNLIEQICDGTSFQVGTQNFSTTGMHQVVLVDNNGCDSTVNLDLKFFPKEEEFLSDEICEGDSVYIGSTAYFETGTFQQIFPSINGCDSTVNLNLTVKPTDRTMLPESICAGDSVEVGNQFFKTDGQFEILLENSSQCDSTVVLDLEVFPLLVTDLNERICSGTSFMVGNEIFTTDGNYQVILVDEHGCDSTVNLDLTIQQVLRDTLEEQLCDGGNIQIGTQSFDQTGDYEVPLITSEGCDSVVFLKLEVFKNSQENLTESICDGKEFEVGTDIFTQTGQYQIDLKNKNGCDSIVNLNLTVLEVFEIPFDRFICPGDSIEIGNEVFKAAGNFSIPFTASNGCDSTVLLNLTVPPFNETNLTETICKGKSFTVGTENFDQSGIYQVDLISKMGCDSVVNLDLSVEPMPVQPIIETLCFGIDFSVGNMIFDQTGTYDIPLTTADGCDSLVQLNLEILDKIETNLVRGICSGLTFQVGNQTFDQTGIYQVVLTSDFGCDSTVNLDLLVDDVIRIDLEEAICEGEFFQVGNEIFDQEGDYQVDLRTSSGCDSIVFLNLKTNPIRITELKETICEGAFFEVGNERFETTGQYSVLLASSDGCDSTVNLDLTVIPPKTTFLQEEICFGKNFQVGFEFFDADGIYEVVLVADNGCDSIITLDLSTRNCEILADIAPDSLNCFEDEMGALEFTITNGNPPFSYEWRRTDAGNLQGNGTVSDLNISERIDNLPAGEYEVIITAVDDFRQTFTTTIGQPSQLDFISSLSEFGSFNLLCPDDESGSIEVNVNGGTPPYRYLWNTGEMQSDLTDIPAGNYQLQILDANNCELIIQRQLIGPPNLDTEIEVRQPNCDDPLGQVSIENPTGGTGTFEFSIDAVNFSDDPVFLNLPSGNYILTLRDENDCELDSMVFINSFIPINVELGDDLTINLGDEIQLNPVYTNGITNYEWVGDSLSCFTCEFPIVSPVFTTQYLVSVLDEAGCLAMDSLTIFVNSDRSVYVPNAFSPNNDGINDFLTVFGGRQIRSVETLQIYSRWGEPVFQKFDFPPNVETVGWDGKFKGESMDPGVFAWFAKVEFIDGVVELLEGDVTLVR